MSLDRLLEQIKSQWATLAAASAALVAIVGAFVTPPPFVGVDVWSGYAKFVVAVLFAIAAIAMTRWTGKTFVPYWLAAVILLLIGGTVLFEYYQSEFNRDTREYATYRIVVGSQKTHDAIAQQAMLIKKNSSATDEDLLPIYGGEVDAIWTRDSVRRNRQVLASLYAGCIVVFCLTVLATVQVIRCASLTPSAPPGGST